ELGADVGGKERLGFEADASLEKLSPRRDRPNRDRQPRGYLIPAGDRELAARASPIEIQPFDRALYSALIRMRCCAREERDHEGGASGVREFGRKGVRQRFGIAVQQEPKVRHCPDDSESGTAAVRVEYHLGRAASRIAPQHGLG